MEKGRRVIAAKTLTILAVVAGVSAVAFLSGCGPTQAPDATEKAPGTHETALPPAAPPVATRMKCVPVATIQSGLEGLRGIAIDGQDRIYLAGASGIRVLDLDGNVLAEWSTPGPARCVALDAEGNVYVGLRTKIEKYDRTGTQLHAWGREGTGVGEFSVVTSIAVRGPNVFVGDAGNRCVHRFDLTGDFIGHIGKRDTEAGVVGLVCPSAYLDCAVDDEGVVHVTNPGALRVEMYRADGGILGFWGEGGAAPHQFCGCCNPTNIALMPGGRTVTAEKAIPRVKIYDRDARMLAYMGPEFFSKDAAGLDLAVDSEGRIYVADPGDGAVHVFACDDAGPQIDDH